MDPNPEHVLVHKSRGVYSSHPCVARLRSGEWLVAFNQGYDRTPFLHPPADPHYVNVVARSSDHGRTWSVPQVAPDFGWYGMENPGITQLSGGDVLLNQFRFDWTPRDLARKRWEAGEGDYFVCTDPASVRHSDHDAGRHEWVPARSAADWNDHAYPYARSDGGAFVQISRDAGRTFELTVPVAIHPYQGAFSPKGAIQLADGDVLLALGSHDYDPLAASFVVRSSDEGRTWQAPVEAAAKAGCVFSEPSVTQTATGRIICISREEVTGHLHQSDSLDGGRTWSTVRRLRLWGYPAHVLGLSDGRVLAVFGRRRPPYGIRAAVSHDDGRSWSDEFALRALPNSNLGYPSVIEYGPGRLFTAYYGEDTDGVTCIQGTYFTLG